MQSCGMHAASLFLCQIFKYTNNNEKRNKDWLKESNVEKNMSETELAKVLDMKRPYLNAIASGKKNVTLKQLERIAEGLGMTLHICFE